MINYKVKAKVDLIDEMINPIISSLEENKADHKTLYQMNLVLEELLVNVANYAYAPNDGDVEICYEIKNKELEVVIIDKGKPFNPLEHSDPDLKAPVEDRKIGGLGIYLVKNLVDDIQYQRVENKNILKINKKF